MELVCIVCPKGCRMSVENGVVTGLPEQDRRTREIEAESVAYPLPEKEAEEAAKKAGPRAPQERSSPERGSGSKAPRMTREDAPEAKPSVRARLAALREAAKSLEPVEPVRGRDNGPIR